MTITKPLLFDRRRRLWLRSRLVELRALILIGIDTLALPLLRIGLFRRDTGKPSVAVFNLHGAGDLLLSLPCLEQIRGRYPAEQYSVVIYCEPAAAELAALFTLGWPSTACRLPALALPNGSRAISSDYILLLPESSSPLKSWPMDRFEALAHQLADLSEETLVFAGTQTKGRPRRHFRKWREGQFLDMSGQTSFLDFMHLIKGASLVITNDSVGLHLGAMLGRPVVAIAGGGLPDRYHPYPAWARVQLTVAEMRLPCYGCNWKCIYEIGAGSPAHCIASVEVNQVLAAVREYLGREPHPTGEVRIELGGAGSARAS